MFGRKHGRKGTGRRKIRSNGSAPQDRHRGRHLLRQPYNLAMVTLDAARLNSYSNLPGTPPYQVPVGAAVAVTFEEISPGQLIDEWRAGG
jgi:uncharacterized OB-fold protein